jgi:hypothetical protein
MHLEVVLDERSVHLELVHGFLTWLLKYIIISNNFLSLARNPMFRPKNIYSHNLTEYLRGASMKLLFCIFVLFYAFVATAAGWSFTTVSDTYSGLEGGLDETLQAVFAGNNDVKFIISTGDFEKLETNDGKMQANLMGAITMWK